MYFLFNDIVKNKKAWNTHNGVPLDVTPFKALIKYILNHHKLPEAEPISIPNSFNGLFSVGDYVIKIFTPTPEDDSTDYFNEVIGYNHAVKCKVPTPEIIATSFVDDISMFRYILMRKAEGGTLRENLPNLSIKQKRRIAYKLSEYIENLHVLNDDAITKNDPSRALDNDHWEKFGSALNYERRQFLKNLLSSSTTDNKVYVHGNITFDNILLDAENNPILIDYEEGRNSFGFVDYATIFLAHGHEEKEFISCLAGAYDKNDLSNELLKGIVSHPRGHELFEKHFDSVTSFSQFHSEINVILGNRV